MDDKKSSVQNDDNSYHRKRVKILFFAAGLATVLHLTLLTMEMLEKGKVPIQETVFYFSVLATYSIQRLVVRWKDVKTKRGGELFVFAVWTYSAVVYFLSVFYNDPTLIPDQLSITWQGVTALFFGTSLTKLLKEFVRKHEKP